MLAFGIELSYTLRPMLYRARAANALCNPRSLAAERGDFPELYEVYIALYVSFFIQAVEDNGQGRRGD